MTPAIDVIEAEESTDRAVALAIGAYERGGHWYVVDSQDNEVDLGLSREDGIRMPSDHRHWEPSDDWNDAMFAAEKFGLFDEHARFLQGNEIWEWTNCYQCHAGCGGNITRMLMAPTGPLAICRAILTLSQQNA